MPLLKIAHYPEPVLLTAGKPVQEDEFNDDLKKLVGDMFETMYDGRRGRAGGAAGFQLAAAVCNGRARRRG